MLEEKYKKEVRPVLIRELGLKNALAAPRLLKVVVSMGVKEGAKDKSVLEKCSAQLAAITGQLPKICRAKKSIAAFSLVKNSPIGLAVTLRHGRMNDFLEKLFFIVLPRLRDFHGVSVHGFDGKGNYNLGLPELVVFPESEYEKTDRSRGLQITIVTSAKNDKIARLLLESMGLPFTKDN